MRIDSLTLYHAELKVITSFKCAVQSTREANIASSVEFSRWLKLWLDSKNANTSWKRENKVLECKMFDASEGQHTTKLKQSISRSFIQIHLHKCNKMHTIPRILIVAFSYRSLCFSLSVSNSSALASIFFYIDAFRSNSVASTESRSRT